MKNNNEYIINSGSGYLLEFINNTPKMTTDPVEANRFRLNDANFLIESLNRMGYSAELIHIRMGRIK